MIMEHVLLQEQVRHRLAKLEKRAFYTIIYSKSFAQMFYSLGI